MKKLITAGISAGAAIAFLFSAAKADLVFADNYPLTQKQISQQAGQQWRYNPLPQQRKHHKEGYRQGYKDGYSEGYNEGYAAGLEQGKKQRKRRKHRKHTDRISGWDIPKYKAEGNADCYAYTFKVRGGEGSAQIANSTAGTNTITLKPAFMQGGKKYAIKKGYVCFARPTRLILSRYEGEETNITLKIKEIGKFSFTPNEPGWRGSNGWRTLRSAYWLLDTNLDDGSFPPQAGWEREGFGQ